MAAAWEEHPEVLVQGSLPAPIFPAHVFFPRQRVLLQDLSPQWRNIKEILKTMAQAIKLPGRCHPFPKCPFFFFFLKRLPQLNWGFSEKNLHGGIFADLPPGISVAEISGFSSQIPGQWGFGRDHRQRSQQGWQVVLINPFLPQIVALLQECSHEGKTHVVNCNDKKRNKTRANG